MDTKLKTAFRNAVVRLRLAEARVALLEAEENLRWEDSQNRSYVPSTYAASYQALVDRVAEARQTLKRLESRGMQ